MKKGPLSLVTAVGFVIVMVAIGLGMLQAEDVFNDVDTKIEVAAAAVAQDTGEEEFASVVNPGVATSTPVVTATPKPVAPTTIALTGSTIVFQVRGGDDPCRYLYTSNRVGTFAGGEIVLEFVAGTHDATGLAATGEMHLYGDTGPHDFEVLDSAGRQVAAVHVGRGETTMATVVFEQVGLYRLFESTMRIHVSEIFARPIGQPGYVPATGWCES